MNLSKVEKKEKKEELRGKLLTSDSKDIAVLEKINQEAFPDNERLPVPQMFYICQKVGGEMIGWYVENRMIGFSMVLSNDSCVYLNYLAMKNSERCKGYGHKILQLLQDRYFGKQFTLDFEVLDPAADNYDIRKRRKAFYLRNGMYETGYYTKLEDTYFELVCNRKTLNTDSMKKLMSTIHSVIAVFSEKLYEKSPISGG